MKKAFQCAVVIAVFVTASGLCAQSPSDSAERPKFDVVSVKENKSVGGVSLARFQPGGLFTANNATMESIITSAYQLKPHELIGGPEWDHLLSEHFDIEAKAGSNASRDRLLLMLQSLLADRFKLVVHDETRQLPVFALVLSRPGKTGPRLTPHGDDAKCVDPAAGLPAPGPGLELPTLCGGVSTFGRAGRVHNSGNKVTIEKLVALLSRSVDRPIVDRTGLNGLFDFTLEFAPNLEPNAQPGAATSAPDSSLPSSIFTALEEQLGLKLESSKGPVDVLVIDHIEEPSEN